MSPKLQVPGPRQNLGQSNSWIRICSHAISVPTPEHMTSKGRLQKLHNNTGDAFD